jgi:hypothetical protein
MSLHLQRIEVNMSFRSDAVDDTAHAGHDVTDGKRFVLSVAVRCSHQVTNGEGSRRFHCPAGPSSSVSFGAADSTFSLHRAELVRQLADVAGNAPHFVAAPSKHLCGHAGLGNDMTTDSQPGRRHWPPNLYPHFWHRYETAFTARPFPSCCSVIVSIGSWQLSQTGAGNLSSVVIEAINILKAKHRTLRHSFQ